MAVATKVGLLAVPGVLELEATLTAVDPLFTLMSTSRCTKLACSAAVATCHIIMERRRQACRILRALTAAEGTGGEHCEDSAARSHACRRMSMRRHRVG